MPMTAEEYQKLLVKFQGDFKPFIIKFLSEMARRALGNIITTTPVDSGHLREVFSVTNAVFEGNTCVCYITNPAEYASYVEDGHMQFERWVPGVWLADGRFKYIPNSKKGMKLTTKWIEGKHMVRIAIEAINQEMPTRFDMAVKKALKEAGHKE